MFHQLNQTRRRCQLKRLRAEPQRPGGHKACESRDIKF